MRLLLVVAAQIAALCTAGAQDRVPEIAVPAATAAAPLEMTRPRIDAARVDWDAVRSELTGLSDKDTPEHPPSGGGNATHDANGPLAKLNMAAAATYKDIEKSAVPVLLPVDTVALLRGSTTAAPSGDAIYFKPHFFMAGPSGYDAVFNLEGPVASEIANFERKEDPILQISGFAMTYDLPPPAAEPLKPSPDLQQVIPGIRRRWLESYSRYSFERYGVTYTVSMRCTDGKPRGRWVACRDADRVIVRFIKSLQLAGGMPRDIPPVAPETVERPITPSPDFTYAPPGRLLPNTGFRGNGGRSDYTVYARIRFPLAQAPAYANSQAFMNWGNCDFTGRTKFRPVKGAAYRCKVNDKPLVFDESVSENRSYPWRDNFCEHRRFFVSQCPGGEGHQGQDIRPVTCKLRNAGADRCQPFLDDVVAVRDGMIMRLPRRESLYLLVNAPGEHIRFRYLHLSPAMLDADGMTSGRPVQEGEVIGKAGNFDRIPNGTSYHLHFEVQVPSRDGWVFVSPYATLITAYERLIGGRGTEVPDIAPPPPPSPTADNTAQPASPAASNTPAPDRKPAPPLASARRMPQHVKKAGAESAKAKEAGAARKRPGTKNAKEAKREKASRHAVRDAEVPTIAAPERKTRISDRSGGDDRKPRRAANRAGADRGVREMGDPVPPTGAGAGDIRNNIQ